MTSNRFSLKGLLTFPVLFLIMLSSGCGKQKQIRGAEFVSHDIMVEMMVDMHLIDGLTNDVGYYRKFNPNDSVDLYGSVYEEYGVSNEEFHTTMMEYSSIPRLLDKMYGEVLKELNLLQEELDREKQLEMERKRSELGQKELLKDVEKKSKKRNSPEP